MYVRGGLKIGIRKLAVLQSDWTAKILQQVQTGLTPDPRALHSWVWLRQTSYM